MIRRGFATSRPLFARVDSKLSLANKHARVAIVGAGPAGFYAASRLLQINGSDNLRIDMFEEQPVPFGLVRFGVAPDHPEVKNCEHKFDATASDQRFRFYGNVQIGSRVKTSAFHAPSDDGKEAKLCRNIPIESLQDCYDALLFTYGASHDRSLDIPGESDLENVFSARSFVHYYNGHPLATIKNIDLSKVENVAIVGQGNVALDCARMLLSNVDSLRNTDTPENVLQALSESAIRHVEIVGRRGPLQFAGTTKEVREMMQLSDVHFRHDSDAWEQASKQLDENANIQNLRMKKRLLGLMQSGSKSASNANKSWSLRYLLSPRAFQPSPYAELDSTRAKVASVDWETNALEGDVSADPASWRAKGTGKIVSTKADLVLVSVGYRSIGIPGLPFDSRAGIIPNIAGRITDSSGVVIPRLYASGWLARGPNGVLTTTMMDAFLTAELIAGDLASSRDPIRAEFDITKLGGKERAVSWTDWLNIDAEERRRGAQLGKPREKIQSVAEMLALLA